MNVFGKLRRDQGPVTDPSNHRLFSGSRIRRIVNSEY